MDVQGKTAIVTGGGRGLGRVIALTLAKAGANLTLISRSREDLEKVADEARNMGRKALIVAGNASQEEIAREAVAKASGMGSLDILVNNAGIAGPIAPIHQISREDWDHAMAVNLTSYFLFSKHAIPVMREQQGGSIINIASLLGLRGYPERSSYCSTKWAVIGMTRAVAHEVGEDNIRVNVVCPGAVSGDRFTAVLHTRARERGISYDEMLGITTKDTPLRRLVNPEEIASAVLFLASDAASGISGEEILVSGGRR